ncbi:MFS transporter [Paenibacillus polygoni]|uniref:MFS transporter n=1 Tax=Paenibacillus polygoni TaxID=3050112 RepID=A0ABY8X2L2_9BACL|nr:MFS transporter [Paenibacillus polygoni]WIV17455.1 MFS transporter [Paenibacillus polygoni]
MSQSNHEAITNPKKLSIPKYIIMSILTIFSIGPQYFLNLSYTVGQSVIQNGLHLSTQEMLIPSSLSSLAFAIGIPLGRIFSKKFGLRNFYLSLVFVFLCGTIIDALSYNITTLIIGRVIQGLSAGMLFLTILSAKFLSFPNHLRQFFMFSVVVGLFGASAIGAIFGTISLSTDAWRWLYMINICCSLLCLCIGFVTLPKQKAEQKEKIVINRKGLFLLGLLTIAFAFPILNLQEKGFDSVYVWPFLVMAIILVAFLIKNDSRKEFPIVPIRALAKPKAVFGTVMAGAGHISLIVIFVGVNGYMRTIKNVSFIDFTYFYCCFFIGIVLSAILCALLYDKWGAGILGIAGSLLTVIVSIKWSSIQPEASLTGLNLQMACLGFGISMTFISGAIGTLFAGNAHQASSRSASLHTIRNYAGAVFAPFLGWFLYRLNANQYEKQIGQLSQIDTISDINAKKAALLSTYHGLFTILLILGVMYVNCIDRENGNR